MTAPQATEELVAPPPTEAGGLHRPMRAVVALVELLLAGLAVWGAFSAWPRGFATITTVVSDGTTLESERVYGNWLAGAIAFGTVAAVLVLDAVRQALLAVRARPRRARRQGGYSGPPTADSSTEDSTAKTEAVPEPVSGPVSDADGDR